MMARHTMLWHFKFIFDKNVELSTLVHNTAYDNIVTNFKFRICASLLIYRTAKCCYCGRGSYVRQRSSKDMYASFRTSRVRLPRKNFRCIAFSGRKYEWKFRKRWERLEIASLLNVIMKTLPFFILLYYTFCP